MRLDAPKKVCHRGVTLARKRTCITFVSGAAAEDGIARRLGLNRIVLPVKNCRKLSKANMRFNDRTGDIKVDPETYTVTVDGEKVTCKPAQSLSLARRYWLF